MNMLQNKISVITVCLNAKTTLEKTILSVISQTYKSVEFIVIDGGSTDGTLEILKNYKGSMTRLISERDNGIYDAMNKGIRYATGDVLYFLNSDDLFYDEKIIEKVMRQFQQEPETQIICGIVELTNLPPNKRFNRDTSFNFSYKSRHDAWKCGICQQRLFVRKCVFEKIGLFDTQYRFSADWEWFLTAYQRGIPIKFIEDRVAIYNFQGFTYRQSSKALREKILIAFRKFPFTIFILYILNMAMRFFSRIGMHLFNLKI